MKNKNIFYDIKDDLQQATEAAIFIVLGGRGTGKTYSTLKYCYQSGKKFLFMKRTNKDIALMCGKLKKGGEEDFSMDLSPFKSLNNDMGWNVRAYRIYEGLGAFWNCDEENRPVGDPVGYCLSFNSISKFKGYDLSDCDFIIFDEFIPLPYERVNRNEGLELMDLYRTVGRANNIKYGTILKLICLANSTTVSCPVLNELELSDTLVNMKNDGKSSLYLSERSIYIRLVPDINGFREEEMKNPIYKAMRGTKWAKMSLDNDFAYNDFSNVRKQSLKGCTCLVKVQNKQNTYYIYSGPNGYYMTYRPANHYTYKYNLNLENDQKKFYYDYVIDLRNECIEDRMKFETYEMYDLIINYKDFYRL